MPDLNSCPPSPRPPASTPLVRQPSQPSHQPSAPSSRRASQIFPMSPPPLPLGGTIPTPQQMHAHQPFPPLSPVLTSATNNSEAGGAAVPMRHPRPLTAAELHLEMEKEQEGVVNRLTRELSALRAHSASVASTTSSTSTAPGLILDPTDPASAHPGALTGPTHPMSSRRHRSSSSVSRTSVSGANPYATPHNTSTGPLPHHARQSLSSAGPSESHIPGPEGRIVPVRSSSVVSLSTPRYEETARYKQQMDEAQRENEVLKQRIRDLEAQVRGRRASMVSESSRERSISSSANATARAREAPSSS